MSDFEDVEALVGKIRKTADELSEGVSSLYGKYVPRVTFDDLKKRVREFEELYNAAKVETERLFVLLSSCGRPLVITMGEVQYLLKIIPPAQAAEIERLLEIVRRERSGGDHEER